MKIEGKFILKVAGTLTAISLVVAALLGATNALTEDKIAAINKANTEVALAAVVGSPDCEFPPIEEIPQAAIDAAKTQSGKLTEAYRVVVNGEDAGYAFKIVAGGSQGDIEMIVGVDADLAITGISVVDAAETSGIGTKVYSIGALQPGDLAFFNDPSRNAGKACSHVGIYIGNGQHIHASSSRSNSVIISDLTSGYYNTYFVGGIHV